MEAVFCSKLTAAEPPPPASVAVTGIPAEEPPACANKIVAWGATSSEAFNHCSTLSCNSSSASGFSFSAANFLAASASSISPSSLGGTGSLATCFDALPLSTFTFGAVDFEAELDVSLDMAALVKY